MSDYTQFWIEETKQAIARKERLMQEHPAPSVEASLQSFQKVLRQLEAELANSSSIETSQPFPESNCIPAKAP